MDISTLRIIATLTGFLMFMGIAVWVWLNRKSKDFEEASQLPFHED